MHCIHKNSNYCDLYPSFVKEAVASVVGRVHPSERFKIQLALKFFKAKLTEFRSEERRKVNVNSKTKIKVLFDCEYFSGPGSCTIQGSMPYVYAGTG